MWGLPSGEMNYFWSEKLRTWACKLSWREQHSLFSFYYSWVRRWALADAESWSYTGWLGNTGFSSQMLWRQESLKTVQWPNSMSSWSLLPCAAQPAALLQINCISRTQLSPMEGRHIISNILVWTALFRSEFVRETRKLGRKHWRWEKMGNPRWESIFSLPRIIFPRGLLVNQIHC